MNGLRIARFFGFEIDIDASWVVILLLVVWTFADAVFPARLPGLSPAVYALMAVIGAGLFFGSVLLHELAHSAMARARGIPVEGITLFIFGGMARIRSEASTPKDEFLITVVGPLSSAAIGFLLLAAAGLAGSAGLHPAVSEVADYLAVLNFILAGFNLVPGFPLDGGRLFRSLVWYVSGDLRKATRWASWSGRSFGYLLIAFGILRLVEGLLVYGIWMILIGWFLARAAASSYRQLALREMLKEVNVADVMTTEVVVVAPDLDVERLVHRGYLRDLESCPVVDAEGRLQGEITLDRVSEVPRERWATTTVSEVMAPVDENRVLKPEDTLATALLRLERSQDRALVVVDGHLRGAITLAEIGRGLKRRGQ